MFKILTFRRRRYLAGVESCEHKPYNMSTNDTITESSATLDEPSETDELDQITAIIPRKRLTVPIVATYLAKGYTQAKIGEIFGLTRQAVNDYIKRHAEELEDIKDFDDRIAQRLKYSVVRALDHLDGRDLKKDRLGDLNSIIGTSIDKIRLIQGQSTQNISVHTSILRQAQAQIEARYRNQASEKQTLSDVSEQEPNKINE